MNRIDSTSVPVQFSPVEGMRLLDVAVQFCWGETADGFGYELQYAQQEDFSDARSAVMQNLHSATKYTYLPEPPLSSGQWFWRVRTMTNEGTFGRWSSARSFTTVTTLKRRPPELVISAEHPLFILYSGDEIVENWQSLPEALRPYMVLRVERHTTEDLRPLCELAQQHEIPILLQLVGPHDVYSGRYARIPLADVEYIFQQFPTVKGIQIVEQSCQGGLSQPRVLRYLIGAIRLAAAYGKVAVWADGHWHGNNIWIDAVLHQALYQTMTECREYLIPMWKMNCGWMPYAIQGAVFGLWAGGAVANWGIEPESWFWYEAGFRELGLQQGFKEGDITLCPPTFWGQMVLMGLSAGAAVYCFEPPDAVWSAPGKISDTGRQVVFPLLSRLVEGRLIPTREQVQEMLRIAYVAGEDDAPWREDGGNLRRLYEGTYGLDHPFEMIPATGRYGWIPILSPHTPEELLRGYSAVVQAGSFQTAAEVRAYFDREYEPKGEGSAWSIQVGNLRIVTNHCENRDVVENFTLPLAGSFLRLEGEVAVNGYLLVQQQTPGEVRLHLNGRSDRKISLRLVLSGHGLPQVEVRPEGALVLEGGWWVVSFEQGAVDLVTRACERR